MILHLPIEPVPAARPRVTQHGTYTPANYAKHQRDLAVLLRAARVSDHRIADGPVSVRITVGLTRPKTAKREYPTVRPDLDNYVKGILDALTEAGAWRDDAQVVEIHARKRYSPQHHIGYWIEWEPAVVLP